MGTRRVCAWRCRRRWPGRVGSVGRGGEGGGDCGTAAAVIVVVTAAMLVVTSAAVIVVTATAVVVVAAAAVTSAQGDGCDAVGRRCARAERCWATFHQRWGRRMTGHGSQTPTQMDWRHAGM
eukprot:2691205-Pleurochrysis_carterae.AAC.1